MATPRLPLTVFEELLFWENRPAYPCSCFARLRFSGRIDRQSFESAIQTVMPRHPLLAARVEAKGRRLFWKSYAGALPEINWSSGPTGQSLPPARFQDLETEIGLKLFVVESPESSDVTLQFHHACCDGAGIESFFNDLMIAYALSQGVQSKDVRLPSLDPNRLRQRGTFGLTFPRLAKTLPGQLLGLPGAVQFFSRSPSPAMPHRALPNGDRTPAGFPATCTHTFTREETAALNRVANQFHVTANDLLARDLYLALDEWRARYASDGDDWLRMMVPINLRSPGDRSLPAANKVGMIFLDRRKQDFADSARLLSGIAQELQLIKDRRLGLIFVYALRMLSVLPGGMKSVARLDKCIVSTIFSNMGRMLRRCPLPKDNGQHVAGNLMLQQIDGVIPILPYNCASFLSIDYAQRLTVTLHYDPRPMSAAQAMDLASTFARRVRATAAHPG